MILHYYTPANDYKVILSLLVGNLLVHQMLMSIKHRERVGINAQCICSQLIDQVPL